MIVTGQPIMNNPRRERLSRSTMRSPSARDEAEFLAALPIIDDVAGHVCRRHRLSRSEAEEFQSEVRLHFIERNYEALRRFEGRASLTTYITVVVQHLFFDNRNRIWGRWRPSTDARRLGPDGVLLERLVTRDGYTLDQAFETLRVNHAVELTDSLRQFGERLTERAPARRLVPEDDAGEIVSGGPGADANVLRAEQDFLAKRVKSALDRARQAMAPMEQLIVKMRFDDRIPVADIARALHLDQRRLYRTIDQLLGAIRDRLLADGVSAQDVTSLLSEDGVQWTTETAAAAPATEVERGTWRQGR